MADEAHFLLASVGAIVNSGERDLMILKFSPPHMTSGSPVQYVVDVSYLCRPITDGACSDHPPAAEREAKESRHDSYELHRHYSRDRGLPMPPSTLARQYNGRPDINRPFDLSPFVHNFDH